MVSSAISAAASIKMSIIQVAASASELVQYHGMEVQQQRGFTSLRPAGCCESHKEAAEHSSPAVS